MSTDVWYITKPSQENSIYSLAKASVIASHIEADIEPYYTIRLDANKEIQTDGYRPVIPSNENEVDTNLEEDELTEINAASEILDQLLGNYLFNKLNEIIGQITTTPVTKVYSKIEDVTNIPSDNESTLDSTFDDENDFDTEEQTFFK
eukprot:gene18625-24360_t